VNPITLGGSGGTGVTTGGSGGVSGGSSGGGAGGGAGAGTGPVAPVTPIAHPSGSVGGPLVLGADVSPWEGTVDWTQAAGAGLGFSIARVSDGLNTHDATFLPNWSGMQANGLVRGVYQYFRASQDPVAQADYLVSQIGSIGPGDLPPFLDFETLDGMTTTQAAQAITAWNAEITAKLGIQPAIYTSARVWALANNPVGNYGLSDLWTAHWATTAPTMPPGWKDWTFWQFTASATIPGINGSPGVDESYFHGSLDDLHAYSGMSTPAGFFRGLAADSTGQGYWTAVYDGGIFAYGDATWRGTAGGQTWPAPILGIVRTPTGYGHWLFGADGNVLTFGDAVAAGNLSGQALAAPIVGMAATPSGAGYWLCGQDGSVTAFGDAATNLGQAAGQTANAVVGFAATPTGKGYWIADASGNVSAFGDAVAAGGLGGQSLATPVVSIAATKSGQGYWLAQADGNVTGFGDAGGFTYTGLRTLNAGATVVSITATLSSQGYWLLATDGTVFAVGDAIDGGSRPR
jgi:GH25 family lysozyme M1 (1,4-beta-N-acetylmuramidase)